MRPSRGVHPLAWLSDCPAEGVCRPLQWHLVGLRAGGRYCPCVPGAGGMVIFLSTLFIWKQHGVWGLATIAWAWGLATIKSIAAGRLRQPPAAFDKGACWRRRSYSGWTHFHTEAAHASLPSSTMLGLATETETADVTLNR